MNLEPISSKSPFQLWEHLNSWQKNLFTVILIQTVVNASWSFMHPLYPLFIQQDLGIDDPKKAAFWAGITSGVLAASMMVFGPIWGYVADRHGRRLMVLRAYTGGAIVLTLAGLVTDVRQLIGVRFLHGALSGSVSATMAMAASSVPRNKIPLAIGLLQFSTFFGVTIGPFFGGVFAEAAGFRATYFLSAGIVGGCAILVLLFVRESFQRSEDTRGGFTLFSEMREIVTTRGILPALTVIIVVQGAPVMLQPVLPGFIQSITSGDNEIVGTGLAFAILGLCSGISAIAIGKYSGSLDLRSVLILSCFASSAAFLPLLFVHNYLIFLLLIGLFGFFSGGMLTSINSLVGILIPKQHLGSAFGVVNSANSIAWGIGPLLGGSLALSIGFRQVFFATAVVLAITGAVVAGFFKAIKQPPPAYGQAGASGQDSTGSGS